MSAFYMLVALVLFTIEYETFYNIETTNKNKMNRNPKIFYTFHQKRVYKFIIIV